MPQTALYLTIRVEWVNRCGRQTVTETSFVYTGTNEYDEARYIARQIKKHFDEQGSFSDCAILYRTNAQSRVIEEMLMRESVPYKSFRDFDSMIVRN